MPTPYAALRAALAADPSRPLVTYVGPEGRTELSVRTFENGVAKAAGLLRDGYDVEPGDVVVLLLPAHWQTALWLGAAGPPAPSRRSTPRTSTGRPWLWRAPTGWTRRPGPARCCG